MLEKERSQQKRQEIRDYLANIKNRSGCIDCKNMYPHYMLDFDHVSNNKTNNISFMARWYSVEDIENEIAKCEIVCANCHRERTYKRQHEKKQNKQSVL